MTFARKRGYENVLEALRLVILEGISSNIVTLNSETSATAIAYKAQNYTFNNASLNFTIADESNGEVDVSGVDITGEKTAAQVATILNADNEFTSIATADTAFGGKFLRIYVTNRGEQSSITFGDDAGHSVLGFVENATFNYFPLRDIAQCEMGFENIPIVAYPGIKMWCVNEDVQDNRRMVWYDIRMRLYETFDTPTFDQVLYKNLARYALLIRDIINAATNLEDQVNVAFCQEISPVTMLQIGEDEMLWRAYVDFLVRVKVQEDN